MSMMDQQSKLKRKIASIMTRPMSIAELVAATGNHDTSLNRALRSMPAHICRWDKRGNVWFSVWSLGDAPHAPRPYRPEFARTSEGMKDATRLSQSYVKAVRIPWAFAQMGGV